MSIITTVITLSRANICTRAPVITGYFRYPENSMPLYSLTWQPLNCHSSEIVQYEIEFVDRCSMSPVMRSFVVGNQTTISVSMSSCDLGKCFARLRAKLNDGSFTDFSLCVIINDQLLQHESMDIECYIMIRLSVVPETTCT